MSTAIATEPKTDAANATARGLDPKAVRTWAIDAGLIPEGATTRGRLSAATLDAYTTAMATPAKPKAARKPRVKVSAG